VKTYKQIRKELESYDKTLLEKDEVIILTKIDVLDFSSPTTKKSFEKIKKDFEKFGKPIFTLSLYDDVSVKKLMDGLIKLLRK
jgi:GTPase involved in cell partitioning and DNA repair